MITFKYRCYPTESQKKTLLRWRKEQAFLYNAALEERISAYRKCGITISLYDQYKQLSQIRKTTEYGRVPQSLSRGTLLRLDKAYKAFFKKNSGFPKFRSWKKFTTLVWHEAKGCKYIGDYVKIRGVGKLRIEEHRPYSGNLKEVRLSQTPSGSWYISLTTDHAEKRTGGVSEVGIDLGISSFIATSDGELVPLPDYFYVHEDRCRRAQRVLSKKQKGSHGRAKARLLVAKAYEDKTNAKKDWIRKLAVDLCQKYFKITVEDLRVANMLKNKKLAPAIYRASWSDFVLTLEETAVKYGSEVVKVNPRYTSQECSACGKIVLKDLSVRVHECSCGLVLDRDINAARNILKRA